MQLNRLPKLPLLELIIASAIIIVPLANSPGLMFGVQTAKTFNFLYLIAALPLLAALALLLKKGGVQHQISLIDILFLSFVAWLSLNKYMVQDHASFSLKYFELLGLTVLYLAVRLNGETSWLLLLVSICVSGAVQAVYGNLQLWGHYPSHHVMFKMTGSFFNPGPYAGFLCCVLPVAVGMYWKFNHRENGENTEGRREKLRLNVSSFRYWVIKLRDSNYNNEFKNRIPLIIKVISLVTIISILLVLPAARSRAAWLGAIAGVAFLAWYKYNVGIRLIAFLKGRTKAFFGAKRSPEHREGKQSSALANLGVFLLPALFILVASFSLYHFKKDSADGRMLIWTVTANIIKDNPILGVGQDMFKAHYMDYQAAYFSDNPNSKYEMLAGDNQYAFNEALLTWAENGLIGLLLAGGIVFAVFFAKRNFIFRKGISNLKFCSADFASSIQVSNYLEPVILNLKSATSNLNWSEAKIGVAKPEISNLKSETILKSSILSILVFGMFAYPTEILPIKMVATICIAILAGMATPLLMGKENSFVSFVKKPSCPLCSSWLNSFLHLKLNLWLKLPLTLATVFVIVLLLPQVNKLHHAYANWNDAYQLYNYNLYAECLEEYEKALPVLQHNGEFLINYGKALSIAEKHPDALEILNRAKAYQSNSVLYTALGDSYKALEQCQSAEQSYLQAANMAPGKFYPLYLLAKLYDASGQQEKAIATANTILNKEVKVQSTAIEEIREEMKTIITK